MPNAIVSKIGNVGRDALNWGINKIGGFTNGLKAIDRVGQIATMQLPFLNTSPIDMIPLDPNVKAKVKMLLGGLHLANEAVQSAKSGDTLSAGSKGADLLGKGSAYMSSGQTGFGIPAPQMGW